MRTAIYRHFYIGRHEVEVHYDLRARPRWRFGKRSIPLEYLRATIWQVWGFGWFVGFIYRHRA